MKQIKFALIVYAIFFFISFAGTAQITFQKQYGGPEYNVAHSVKQTIDGGYIIVGTVNDIGSSTITKTDENGNVVWSLVLSDPPHYPTLYFVDLTSDSGYIVTGQVNPTGGTPSTYLAKYSSAGTLEWENHFGFYNMGNCVRQTSDNGYIIGGGYSYYGNSAVQLIKTDEAGNLTWSHMYGSASTDEALYTEQTSDGGYILTGVMNARMFLLKTDATGDTIWQKIYGDDAAGYCVHQATDGGYIASARVRVADLYGSHYVMWLIKTDENGDTSWTKSFNYTTSFPIDVEARSVVQTADGGYVAAGYYSDTSYISYQHVVLVKTDATGNLVWVNYLNGFHENTMPRELRMTQDGGFVVVGAVYVYSTEEIYLAKTDSAGNIAGLTCAANFNLYPDTLIPHHYWAVNMATGNAPLTYLWNWGDGNYDSIAYPSHIYSEAGIYGICLNIHDSTGCFDAICMGNNFEKMSAAQAANTMIQVDVVDSIPPSIPTSLQNATVLHSWSVFPNPASGNSFINYTLSNSATISIALYDVLGNKIQQLLNADEEAGEYNSAFDARKLANGIYLLQIHAGDQIASQKIVVMN